MVDTGAKLGKSLIDELLYTSNHLGNSSVSKIVKVRPYANEYDKLHWMNFERRIGMIVPEKTPTETQEGIFVFKGTLQEYAEYTNRENHLARKTWKNSGKIGTKPLKPRHQILMHDCIYYFEPKDIEGIKSKIHVGIWHVSGIKFAITPIRTKVF